MPTIASRIATDLSKFFDTGVFAKSATSTPPGGSGTSIKVIFDESFETADPVDINAVTTMPVAIAKTSDVSTQRKGGTLVVDSVTYYVMHTEPDGVSGMTRLLLSRVNP